MSSQPQQLLGQPQVAPQYILAGQTLAAAAAAGQGQAGAATVPVQQLLIPVSAANGTQQLLSIPLSLAAGAGAGAGTTGAGGQLQLLTSNGQLLATNLASLGQAALGATLQNQGMLSKDCGCVGVQHLCCPLTVRP